MENVYLDVLDIHDIEKVRIWRNEAAKEGVYRTPYLLTRNMQLKFFEEVVCNRNSNSRYLAIRKKEENFVDIISEKNKLIGIAGLTGIQWENRIAEIALTLSPEYVGKGYGKQSFILVLTEGFSNLNLINVYGECYYCNPKIKFWEKMIIDFNGYKTMLPARKYFKGILYNSLYFNFNKYEFEQEDGGNTCEK